MAREYVVSPTDEFIASLNQQLAADPERLPAPEEFYPDGLIELVRTVTLLWDQADAAPEGGAGDYRDVWHQDEYGVLASGLEPGDVHRSIDQLAEFEKWEAKRD